jgi:FlaA1/EpsC-like NDP-sugar epimerase
MRIPLRGNIPTLARQRAADAAPAAAKPWQGSLTLGLGILRRQLRHLFAPRGAVLALAYTLVFILVYWLAFLLRFDFNIPVDAVEVFWATLPWILAIKFCLFFVLGQYEGWWAYVTFADLIGLIRAAVLATLVIASARYFCGAPFKIPRSVLVMDGLGCIAVLGALRGSWRLYSEQFRPMFSAGDQRWALLVGTDHATGVLAHQIQSHAELPYRIRGLLSTDNSANGARLGQFNVLGRLEDIREIAAMSKATDVLITAGTLAGPRMRNLMNACREADLELKIIRRLEDRLSGDHRVPMRDIEISDLLRRAPVVLDMRIIDKLIDGRTVMVTGAGGSIGSEICRQLLRFKPKAMVLVGRGENRIFRLERRLQSLRGDAALWPCIADVTNPPRMRELFCRFRPEVVFHAAAHKHVPLMELNASEAIRNNVGGTRCLADLAHEFGVRNFVLVSTDKAVHPTSVMGASKQLAERYVHALSQVSATKFTVVRFGNVLGSDGSVVPIFQEQIRRGGPITVTDPRMTRFFMTIPEASQLVLQAAAMGNGGEIFVLEMGEPVKIVDLARDLIRLSGLPEESMEISFTGVRPGEKLYEELYFDDEETLPTAHPKVRAAYHRPYTLTEVRRVIADLEQVMYAPNEAVRQKLAAIMAEYAGQGGDDDGTDSAGTPLASSRAPTVELRT